MTIFQFIENKKSGHGVFAWPSGARYEGEFFDNIRVGKGELKTVNFCFVLDRPFIKLCSILYFASLFYNIFFM